MEQQVKITYTNYKGETSERRIMPKEIIFTATQWHSEEQWILVAQDLDKGEERGFAMKDIKSWE